MIKLLRVTFIVMLILASNIMFGQTPVDIAGFKNLADATTATLYLDNDTVLYADADNFKVYVKDKSGAICFFRAGLNLKTGDLLNGTLGASVSNFHGMKELVGPVNSEKLTKSGNITPIPTKLTVAQASNDKYVCDFVQLTDVKFDGKDAVQDGATLKVYDGLKMGGEIDMTPGDKLTITGIMSYYEGTYEIFPLTITGDRNTNIGKTVDIAGFKQLSSGEYATLNLVDAKVLAKNDNGTTLFVRDEKTGAALQLYKIDGLTSVNVGDLLTASIYGSYELYKGVPELTNGKVSNVSNKAGDAPKPVVLTLADMENKDRLDDLIQLKDVTIDGGFAKDAAGNQVQLYDGLYLKISIPNGEHMTVTGILTKYNNNPEIFVTNVEGEVSVKAVDNIAAFKTLGSGATAKLTLKDAQVLAMNDYKDKIYVRDNTGAILFYKATGLTCNVNDMLNGTITGTMTIYNGVPELTGASDINVQATPSTTPAQPKVKKIAELNDDALLNDLVQIADVTVTGGMASQGADIVKLYNGYLGVSSFPDGAGQTITGILTTYKGEYEILPTNITSGNTPNPPAPNGTVNIAGFKALGSGATGTLKLENAKVLAMNDYRNKIYIRDASGYILLYKVDQLSSVNVGDVLNGTIKGTYKPYWDTPELQYASEVNVTNTPGEAPVARKMKVSEIKNSDINDLVQIDGSIEYQNAKDETGSIKLYNGYLMPQTQFPDGKNKIIQGIVGIYKGTLEIFPTSIKDGIVNGINGVNAQNDENAPIYNLAGQRVNKSYKGVVIRNGKKYVQK